MKELIKLWITRILCGLTVVIFLSVVAVSVLTYYMLKPYYLRAQTYDLKKIESFNVATVFYDRAGIEIGRLFIEDRILLKHDEIPDIMRHATVAAEDRRFYSHGGVDPRGISRAFAHNLKKWKLSQGGSTITQQIAKHLIGRFERTLDRKLVEAFLAYRIERKYSKDEILDFYLNRIYFGKGYFGIGAAAKGYFGKQAKDLSLSECATLASIIKAPNVFSPRNNIQASMRRRNMVLGLMVEQKFIPPDAAAEASTSQLSLVMEKPVRGQGYFTSLAIKELRKVLDLDEDDDIPQGLVVATTLDSSMQRTSEIEATKKLAEIGKLWPAPASADNSELQVGAVVLDLNTGAVRVLIGGRNYEKSPFDRVRMARRDNGALLQPFIYSLAFERLHLHPASMINASYLDDSALMLGKAIGLGDPQQDLGKPFLMIQDALALSNKSTALRAELQLGLDTFNDWLSSAGIPRAQSNDSTPLTLYEITSLYQMLGNSGLQHNPYTIESIINDNGEMLYQAFKTEGTRLLDPLTAKQMTLSLQTVTRDGTAGMLTQDYKFPSPVVGMTGYSTGYRDAWFVGYTPSLATGVWVGYDKSLPIEPRALATKSALSIWGNLMQKIMEKNPQGAAFPIPTELSKVEIERSTGVLKGLAFMSPGPGDVFVYLRQDQINELQTRAPTDRVEQPKDWANWLSTMFSNPTQDSASLVAGQAPTEDEIPPVVKYRMPALRGDILTADGKRIATMIQSQDLVLNWPAPEVARDEESVLMWVREHLLLAQKWLKADFDITDIDLRSLHRYQRFHPIVVAQNLTPAQVAEFKKTTLENEGFSLQGVPRRLYPQGTSLSHVLGYLQRHQGRSRKQFQADDVIYEDYQGGAGLEELFDKELKGQEGEITIETTPEGFTKRAIVTREATAGSSLRLTIDSRIQKAAEAAIEGMQSGAVVVMNIHNGDIVAMASRPTFDPNEFIPFLSPEKWQALIQDPKNPLLDRVYRQQNPPGSSFKIVTTLAAMRAGVFDENRAIPCPGYFEVGNMRYELPQERSSPVSFNRAIAHSYNTYFFDLGLRTGVSALIATAHDLGFGQPTGIILPGELGGLIPDDAFVRKTHSRAMGPGDLANSSIGQGDVLVTPLQMVVMASTVANGGTIFRPRIAQQIETRSGQVIKAFPGEITRRISLPPPDKTRTLINGLVAVTDEGTAKAAQVTGIKVASKTGTAQVGSKAKPRQIAWLVGFLPAYQPQYAFAVMIEGTTEDDLHGGEDAAPVVGQLFGKIYSPSSTSISPILTRAKTE